LQISTDRILVTHVGSLPRSQAVTDVLFARDRGDAIDEAAADAVIAEAVTDVARRQVASGVDVISDGEMSKISYATYIKARLTGFAGDTPREPGQDLIDFPRILQRLAQTGATAKYTRPRCVAAIRVKDTQPAQTDIANLRHAIAVSAATEGFLNAASPGVIALFQPNEYYGSADQYLDAVAEAMRSEYEAIVNAGLLLQIDAPDLAMGRTAAQLRPSPPGSNIALQYAVHIHLRTPQRRNQR
jgi:5-methyltetrahydropteroyltriglutamate--homocysteine methyltransferase